MRTYKFFSVALLSLGLSLGLNLAPGLLPQARVPAAHAATRPYRVLMIVNEGLWAPEYYVPRYLFEQKGYKITVAGKYPGMVQPDRRNTDYKPVKVDLTFEQVKLADYDAITFAGGNGAWTDYFPNDTVHKLLAEALATNKVTGLLCASTGLLGLANNYDGKGTPVAKGRHVTGYFRVEGILKLGLVKYDPGDPQKPYAVIDGNLITGRDPISSQVFAEAVIKVLEGQKD